ncbi:MAG: FAD-linked oxidase C-terminal domain-containing protein [Hyphomicrobiales bacterium]|nr:FAD-linked oxidase C-terminal domain-containing protein [Hyphomicrobiales bacterium]
MPPIPLARADEQIVAKREQILAALARAAPGVSIVSDPAGRRAFETDALTAYRCPPLAAVLPKSTAETSAVMRFCHENGLRVVARGAGTSLTGGALPTADAIILGVSRMNRILEMNFETRTARVEAGITNLAISNAAAARGFFYAPDPSSQLACTLGGNIAMNSGGAHCLKYGVTTNNVLGLTLVAANGDVIELGGQGLDPAAYDLVGLVVGSEGQFGVVTEATVRILRLPEGARPMLIGFATAEEAGACVAAIIARGIIPVAIEYMDKPAIKVCEEFAKAGYPLDVEAMLIVEVEGSEDEIAALLADIARIADDHGATKVRVSQSAEEAAAIWKGRKSAFGALGRISDYLCMDGVIPLSRLPDVLRKTNDICDGYGLKVANIFHAGDGNLHPLIMFDANDPVQKQKAEDCGAELLKLCVEAGGCITGEHGVGIEKRDLMPVQFTPADLEQQMRVKHVFDPDWRLNPGKVFPLAEQAAFQAAERGSEHG